MSLSDVWLAVGFGRILRVLSMFFSMELTGRSREIILLTECNDTEIIKIMLFFVSMENGT